MDELESDSELVAYHEAGHAVMAVLLGGSVMRLSICDPDGWGVGDAKIAWKPVNDPACRTLCDLKTALAGPIAEMVFVGDYDYLRIRSEHAADWERVQDCLVQLQIKESSRTEFLQKIVADLYETVRQDAIWAAIGDVADALMLDEELDGDCVNDLVGFWLRQSLG